MLGSFGHLAHFEWLRLTRSRARLFAIVAFLLCGVYAVASGLDHARSLESTIAELDERERVQRDEVDGWFASGRTGPEDRTYIDVSQPRWADRYALTHSAMQPEPLAALAIGLSDVRSHWAPVTGTGGAQSFEGSDPATLGNAERLLAGNFDLAFVLAYLMPLLLLLLVFDVGGLERDLGLTRLVHAQTESPTRWLFLRAVMPVLVVAALVALLCLMGGVWTGALSATPGPWLAFTGVGLGYTLVWGALFGAVLFARKGTATAALWLVGLWLGFSVVLPAGVRQWVSQDHPPFFAVERFTELRAERYEILLDDSEVFEPAFFEARPELRDVEAATDGGTRSARGRMVQTAAFHDVVSAALADVSADEQAREDAVATLDWLNPTYVFQRALCVLAGTESVSYRDHRAAVLAAVDARLELLINEQWLGDGLDADEFARLNELGTRASYGQLPEGRTYLALSLLAAAALIAGAVVGRVTARRAWRGEG